VASTTSGQLIAALDEIAARRATASLDDDIDLITLSIGGNDAYDLMPVCASATLPLDPASECGVALSTGIKEIRANLTTILVRLRGAAGPNTRIVVLTYPNSLVGCSLSALAPIGEVGLEGDGKTIDGLTSW
jgi:lysophospholipase L1-like esterase